MDYRKLGHVVCLADEGSFTKAAETLHLTQSALSRSIQALEQDLGLALFDRLSSGVRPTPAGEMVIARARNLLRQTSGLAREVALIREARLGRIRFGAGPLPTHLLLPRLLPKIMADHPSLTIVVDTEPGTRLLRRLLDEEIEFFVADIQLFADQPGLEADVLAHLPVGFFVRAGHPLASQRSVTPQQLTAYPLAANTFREPPPQATADFSLPGFGLPWSGRVACHDTQVLKLVALNSDAVLITANAIVAEDVRQGALCALAIDGLPQPLLSNIAVVKLEGRTLSPAADLLITEMRRILEQD